MRPRIGSALLCVVGLAFVAAGVFILVRGPAENARLAYGIIALFGACVVSGATGLVTADDRVIFGDAGEVRVTGATLRDLGLAIASAGMATGAYFLAPIAAADGATIVAFACYFGVAFFGLGVPIGAWRVLRPLAVARLSVEGASLHNGRVRFAWRDIGNIHASQSNGWAHLSFASTVELPRDEGEEDDEHVNGYSFSARLRTEAFEKLQARAIELWKAAR